MRLAFKTFGALTVASLLASCATVPGNSTPTNAPGGERILRFHSAISVQRDGWLDITETITVVAEGDIIKRGIFRDLPIKYSDADGNVMERVYETTSVLRNGVREDLRTIQLDNGVRAYFGNVNRMLAPGSHTYDFRYRAGPVVQSLDDHELLYWNVTGHGWVFSIDKASATVELISNGNIEIQGFEARTGVFGAVGQDYVARLDEPSAVTIESTKMLAPGEGLTILVLWPKGYVFSPAVVHSNNR